MLLSSKASANGRPQLTFFAVAEFDLFTCPAGGSDADGHPLHLNNRLALRLIALLEHWPTSTAAA